MNNIRQWISGAARWMANNWRTRGGIAVMAFLAFLVVFPLLTFRGCPTSTPGGTTMASSGFPISFPFLLLTLVFAVYAALVAMKNPSKLAIGGLLSLSFVCLLLSVGSNYPLNTRIGILWDSTMSLNGMALFGLAALALYFGTKSDRGIAPSVMNFVLVAIAAKFALPIIQGYLPEAKALWKDITGIDSGISAFLTIFSFWLLFSKVKEGDQSQKRLQGLPRLGLWLALILVLIPSTISSNAKKINDGRDAFKQEVPSLFNWSDGISMPTGGLFEAVGVHWNNFVDSIRINGEERRQKITEEKDRLSLAPGAVTNIAKLGVPATVAPAAPSGATTSAPAPSVPIAPPASSPPAPATTVAPVAVKSAVSGPVHGLGNALLLKGECRNIVSGPGWYLISGPMSYAGDGRNFVSVTGGRFEIRVGDTNPRIRADLGGSFTVSKM
jgi:hypothetical protein